MDNVILPLGEFDLIATVYDSDGANVKQIVETCNIALQNETGFISNYSSIRNDTNNSTCRSMNDRKLVSDIAKNLQSSTGQVDISTTLQTIQATLEYLSENEDTFGRKCSLLLTTDVLQLLLFDQFDLNKTDLCQSSHVTVRVCVCNNKEQSVCFVCWKRNLFYFFAFCEYFCVFYILIEIGSN